MEDQEQERQIEPRETQYKIIKVGSGPEVIDKEKYPLTYELISSNIDRIPRKVEDTFYPDFVKEFYFVEGEWETYRDELTNPEYPYHGLNIYLSDEKTVALQITKMF